MRQAVWSEPNISMATSLSARPRACCPGIPCRCRHHIGKASRPRESVDSSAGIDPERRRRARCRPVRSDIRVHPTAANVSGADHGGPAHRCAHAGYACLRRYQSPIIRASLHQTGIRSCIPPKSKSQGPKSAATAYVSRAQPHRAHDRSPEDQPRYHHAI
jgi:hypothetical protein